MRTKTLKLCAALALGGAVAGLAWHSIPRDAADPWILTIESSEAEHRFRVELAVTEAQRARGLMHREALDADAGMLLVYRDAGVRTMWMKNTRLSLDMLFVGPDGAIREIVRSAVPYSETVIVSPRDIQYVLELRAGTARRLGIRAGDRVRNLPPSGYSPPLSSS